MGELFISFMDSGFAKPILFALIMGGLYKLSSLGRGKRRKRNYELILRRLKGKGFGKWMILDFLFFCLATPLIAAPLFGIFYFLSYLILPQSVIYQDNINSFIFMGIASVFFGIYAQGMVWPYVVKPIHKKKFKKYLLFTMALQGIDVIQLHKIIGKPYLFLMVIIGVLSANTYEYISGETLVENGFTSILSIEHNLTDVDEFIITNKAEAPNGNIIINVHLEVKFTDGHIWISQRISDDYSQEEMTELARHIYQTSKVEPVSVEFSPFTERGQLSMK